MVIIYTHVYLKRECKTELHTYANTCSCVNLSAISLNSLRFKSYCLTCYILIWPICHTLYGSLTSACQVSSSQVTTCTTWVKFYPAQTNKLNGTLLSMNRAECLNIEFKTTSLPNQNVVRFCKPQIYWNLRLMWGKRDGKCPHVFLEISSFQQKNALNKRKSDFVARNMAAKYQLNWHYNMTYIYII